MNEMTKWISNKLLIRLIYLSSTCCVCVPTNWYMPCNACGVEVDSNFTHYLCQCHITQQTVYIGLTLSLSLSSSLSCSLWSPWFSPCMERFQCISDRLLLMYGIPDTMLTQYVIRCVYGVHTYIFFTPFFARSWSNIVCFCSCVISYKRCIAIKANGFIFDHFQIESCTDSFQYIKTKWKESHTRS